MAAEATWKMGGGGGGGGEHEEEEEEEEEVPGVRSVGVSYGSHSAESLVLEFDEVVDSVAALATSLDAFLPPRRLSTPPNIKCLSEGEE